MRFKGLRRYAGLIHFVGLKRFAGLILFSTLAAFFNTKSHKGAKARRFFVKQIC